MLQLPLRAISPVTVPRAQIFNYSIVTFLITRTWVRSVPSCYNAHIGVICKGWDTGICCWIASKCIFHRTRDEHMSSSVCKEPLDGGQVTAQPVWPSGHIILLHFNPRVRLTALAGSTLLSRLLPTGIIPELLTSGRHPWVYTQVVCINVHMLLATGVCAHR